MSPRTFHPNLRKRNRLFISISIFIKANQMPSLQVGQLACVSRFLINSTADRPPWRAVSQSPHSTASLESKRRREEAPIGRAATARVQKRPQSAMAARAKSVIKPQLDAAKSEWLRRQQMVDPSLVQFVMPKQTQPSNSKNDSDEPIIDRLRLVHAFTPSAPPMVTPSAASTPVDGDDDCDDSASSWQSLVSIRPMHL